MKVKIDTSSMHGMNVIRGVGVYTQKLKEYLEKSNKVLLVEKKQNITHYPFFDLFFHTLPIFKRTKTVVTIHDVIPLVFKDKYRPGIKGSLKFYLQKFSLHSVDAIITDSLCSKLDIVSYLDIPKDKVHIVYLASDPQIKKMSVENISKIREKYTLPKKYILYVGDINYNKNLLTFISACKKVSEDIHVVMVGSSLLHTEIPEGKELLDRIKLEHMENRVHLLTTVPRFPATDLACIFSDALCYVQPSLHEGFGLSVLDAMRCGVPVACSNISSLPEVCGDAAIYFNPNDVEDMAKTIQRVCSLSHNEKNILHEKMKMQEKKFSWEKTAEATINVYKKVMGIT